MSNLDTPNKERKPKRKYNRANREREWHGMTGTPEYVTWYSMKQRCYDKNQVGYEWYGARGIGVCDRWRNSFNAFYEDMGKRPSPKHSIDRIDNSKDYSPDNCQWSKNLAQTINRGMFKNNTSGYTGVVKSRGKWIAQIKVNYESIRLGTFETIEEAAEARKAAEERYWR